MAENHYKRTVKGTRDKGNIIIERVYVSECFHPKSRRERFTTPNMHKTD
jgi:hypothetical protein